MTEVAEKESKELVAAPSLEKALDVFVSEKGLEPYLQTIRQHLDQFLAEPPSLDTKKGRDAYASMAFKIARSKTALDAVGMELAADLKEKPKKVDASRKRMRDQLDAWRDEARGPLNEWEAAEEARKAGHQAVIDQIRQDAQLFNEVTSQEIEGRIKQVETIDIGERFEEFEAEAHRVKTASLDLKVALDRQQRYEAEQSELERLRQDAAQREQKEREERIAREAEERTRREAEQAAQAEREAVAQREQQARDEAARKEREHQEVIAKAQRDAEAERQRIEAEHQRKEQARIAEQQRQEQERAEQQRREQEGIALIRSTVAG